MTNPIKRKLLNLKDSLFTIAYWLRNKASLFKKINKGKNELIFFFFLENYFITFYIPYLFHPDSRFKCDIALQMYMGGHEGKIVHIILILPILYFKFKYKIVHIVQKLTYELTTHTEFSAENGVLWRNYPRS